MKDPLVVLDLISVGDAPALSDPTWTPPNRFLVIKYMYNMCHTRFENINYLLFGLDLVDIDDING